MKKNKNKKKNIELKNKEHLGEKFSILRKPYNAINTLYADAEPVTLRLDSHPDRPLISINPLQVLPLFLLPFHFKITWYFQIAYDSRNIQTKSVKAGKVEALLEQYLNHLVKAAEKQLEYVKQYMSGTVTCKQKEYPREEVLLRILYSFHDACFAHLKVLVDEVCNLYNSTIGYKRSILHSAFKKIRRRFILHNRPFELRHAGQPEVLYYLAQLEAGFIPMKVRSGVLDAGAEYTYKKNSKCFRVISGRDKNRKDKTDEIAHYINDCSEKAGLTQFPENIVLTEVSINEIKKKEEKGYRKLTDFKTYNKENLRTLNSLLYENIYNTFMKYSSVYGAKEKTSSAGYFRPLFTFLGTTFHLVKKLLDFNQKFSVYYFCRNLEGELSWQLFQFLSSLKNLLGTLKANLQCYAKVESAPLRSEIIVFYTQKTFELFGKFARFSVPGYHDEPIVQIFQAYFNEIKKNISFYYGAVPGRLLQPEAAGISLLNTQGNFAPLTTRQRGSSYIFEENARYLEEVLQRLGAPSALSFSCSPQFVHAVDAELLYYSKKLKSENKHKVLTINENNQNLFVTSGSVLQQYNALLKLYLQAKLVTVDLLGHPAQSRVCVHPLTVLLHLIRPFKRYVVGLNQKSLKYSAFVNYFQALQKAAIKHIGLHEAYKDKLTGKTFVAIQYYATNHYLAALVSFRNAVRKALGGKFASSKIKKYFKTLGQTVLLHHKADLACPLGVGYFYLSHINGLVPSIPAQVQSSLKFKLGETLPRSKILRIASSGKSGPNNLNYYIKGEEQNFAFQDYFAGVPELPPENTNEQLLKAALFQNEIKIPMLELNFQPVQTAENAFKLKKLVAINPDRFKLLYLELYNRLVNKLINFSKQNSLSLLFQSVTYFVDPFKSIITQLATHQIKFKYKLKIKVERTKKIRQFEAVLTRYFATITALVDAFEKQIERYQAIPKAEIIIELAYFYNAQYVKALIDFVIAARTLGLEVPDLKHVVSTVVNLLAIHTMKPAKEESEALLYTHILEGKTVPGKQVPLRAKPGALSLFSTAKNLNQLVEFVPQQRDPTATPHVAKEQSEKSVLRYLCTSMAAGLKFSPEGIRIARIVISYFRDIISENKNTLNIEVPAMRFES